MPIGKCKEKITVQEEPVAVPRDGEPEPEPLGKKVRSRSRLEKKSGAGANKKLAGSSALI